MFTHFQDYVERLRPHLTRSLKPHLSALFEEMDSDHAQSLTAALEGGKKIRGSLVCMISQNLGGSVDASIPRAVAVELIQTATLIHDDFVDQHRMRRNKPTIWTLEGARKAVLFGDAIFSTAIKMMMEMGRDDGVAVANAILQISRGALREPLEPVRLGRVLDSGKLDGAIYDHIIHLKTGVLFGTACHLGAIAANASQKRRDLVTQYGLRIGEAYQIADDLKEVNAHLQARTIHPLHMASLAPALLYFTEEIRPYVSAFLRNGGSDMDSGLRDYFSLTAGRMEAEVKRRLRAAVSKISNEFPNNAFRELALRAPWDLIELFNQSGVS